MSKFKIGQVAKTVPFDVDGLTSNSPDITGLTDVQEVIEVLTNRNFGKNFAQNFTAGKFSTTSRTFQTIQTIPSTAITPGNYVIISHGRYLKTLLPAQVGIRIQVNGIPVLDEEEIAMDDDDFFFGHTTIVYVPNLSGNITVTSQIRKISGGGSVEAESRTLMIWRVS